MDDRKSETLPKKKIIRILLSIYKLTIGVFITLTENCKNDKNYLGVQKINLLLKLKVLIFKNNPHIEIYLNK